MMGIMLSMLNPAHAWECITYSVCGCDWADGSQLTYHINVNDFAAAGVTEIAKVPTPGMLG